MAKATQNDLDRIEARITAALNSLHMSKPGFTLKLEKVAFEVWGDDKTWTVRLQLEIERPDEASVSDPV